MIKKYCLFFLVLCVFFIGCSRKTDSFKPDLSTPESAVKTIRHAAANNEGEIFLDAISEELKSKYYGKTREEQLNTFREDSKKKKRGVYHDAALEFTGIKQVGIDQALVDVFFNEIYKGKIVLQNGHVRMIKENDLWKLALDERFASTRREFRE